MDTTNLQREQKRKLLNECYVFMFFMTAEYRNTEQQTKKKNKHTKKPPQLFVEMKPRQ